MGIFERLFPSRVEKIKADSTFKMLTTYAPVFTNWSGKLYESGLVRSAINAKASHVSKMEVRVSGSARPTLQTRLKSAPNEFQTWSQFLYRLSTILDMKTTAYIVPILDEYDNTTGIYCTLPQTVEFVQFNGVPFVRFSFADGRKASIELSRVGIMTKLQYRNELIGDGNDALAQTMALIDIQNQGIKEGVKSAATYRFMAQAGNFSTADDIVKERKLFSAKNLNADDGGLLLFPNSYSNIKQIDSKPFVVDADQMRIIQNNVYDYFGVNGKIIQNSASADELDSFYNGCLEPFATQLSEVLTKMLFTSREQSSGARVIVASDRLQYMSVVNKIALATSMGDRGVLTINEIRELLNYAPIEDGDRAPIRGEYYFVGEKDGDTSE